MEKKNCGIKNGEERNRILGRDCARRRISRYLRRQCAGDRIIVLKQTSGNIYSRNGEIAPPFFSFSLPRVGYISTLDFAVSRLYRLVFECSIPVEVESVVVLYKTARSLSIVKWGRNNGGEEGFLHLFGRSLLVA